MLNPFDWQGPAFLQLYVGLLLLASLATVAISRVLRTSGAGGRTLDADQFAYLAGGRTRFVDAVVAGLMARGALDIDRKRRFYVAVTDVAHTPAERLVLEHAHGASWRDVMHTLSRAAAVVERRLIDAGLLLDADARNRLRMWQAAPYAVLFGFGMIKWMVGQARDRPVGYLTLLLALTALLALLRALVIDRRTHGGNAVLAHAREGAGRLRRAPTANEVDLAVALFGTAVLIGSPWADYHRLRNESAGDGGGSSGDGGSGDSSGDGGGGCGGGGCGGCGD